MCPATRCFSASSPKRSCCDTAVAAAVSSPRLPITSFAMTSCRASCAAVAATKLLAVMIDVRNTSSMFSRMSEMW